MDVRRGGIWLFGLALGVLLLFVADVVLGSVHVGWDGLWGALRGESGYALERAIVVGFRLPKALTSLLAGMGLAVSGLLMQTAFRNPLAGPYVLGISSGASLGAALAILAVGSGVLISPFSLAASAWLGSSGALLLILMASVRLRSNATLLIFGVMLSAVAGAGVSILQYVSDAHALKRFTLWVLGSLGNVTGGALLLLTVGVLVGLLLAYLCVRPLNLLLLGSEAAHRLGLPLGVSRVLVFGATTLLAGTVTAYCGPIGFIGIAIPHVARWVMRTAKHGPLITATCLLGGLAMLLTDIISQLPGSDTVLPVNAVASLLGLPVVLHILLTKRGGA